MKLIHIFLTIFIFYSGQSFGQFLIPGEGIMDVKIGSDWDEIEWELGFRGIRVEKEDANASLKHIAAESKIDYDFIVSYQHLMWLPVSELFFKDGKVCMIQLSSYPEYNMMICVDIGTTEGLNFWDDTEKIEEIYGSEKISESGDKGYLVFNEKGIGVELLDNEARSMFIFQPQMK